MKKNLQKWTENKPLFTLIVCLLLLVFLGSGILIYSLSLLTGIENFLRVLGRIVLLIFALAFLFVGIRILNNPKKKVRIFFFCFLAILYTLVTGYVGYQLFRAVGKLDQITTNSNTYSTSVIALKGSKAKDIKDVSDHLIGMLDDESSVDGYEIAKTIIEEQKFSDSQIKRYRSYPELLKALYAEEIDFAFVPTNYSVLFVSLDGFSNIKEETKIIYSKDKKVTSKKNTAQKKLTEPFTILLMGVDSEYENIADSSFNGDSLMLITFNPDTLNTTMLSIPRDTYVPISCFAGQRKNKITHAAWYGQDCMIDTIENFTGITIDYYVKINFKGLVKLVDALEGVDVEVPYSFCEQSSNRIWGDQTVYVREGLQTLSGEQALALARNRHPNPQFCSSEWTNYTSNDFVRGQNQQLVIKAILNKMKSIRSVDKIQALLDVVSNSMETNLTKEQIFSLYDVGVTILSKSKDLPVEELLMIQRLSISGFDSMIYDYSTYNNQGTGMTLYNFVPYKGSLTDISNAMKVNLGLLEETVIKNFSFDVNDPYVEGVIGEKNYNENTLTLLPNFEGKSQSTAVSFCNTYGITLNVETIDSNDSIYSPGMIDSQSVHHGIDLDAFDKSKGLTITVVKESSGGGNSSKDIDCMDEENEDNVTTCGIPTFTGESVAFVKSWFRQYSKYSIQVKYEGPDDVDDEDTVVTDQSTTYGSIYSLQNDTFIITYEAKND